MSPRKNVAQNGLIPVMARVVSLSRVWGPMANHMAYWRLVGHLRGASVLYGGAEVLPVHGPDSGPDPDHMVDHVSPRSGAMKSGRRRHGPLPAETCLLRSSEAT